MQRHNITQDLCLSDYKITKAHRELTMLRIHVEPYKRKKFICSKCHAVHVGKINSRKNVAVEDLRFFGKRVWLHVTKRQMRCPLDGNLHGELVEWIKPRDRVKKRFAQDVYRLTSITTNTEAGWYLGLDDEQVYGIGFETLQDLAAKRLEPIPAATNMSAAEVSCRKYYWYLTNVIDVDIRKVIWNAMGRTTEVLNKYYNSIGKAISEEIESVALDSAMTYIDSQKRIFSDLY